MQQKSFAHKFLITFVATGAFTGFFPIASGTVGSLLAVGLIYFLRDVPQLLLVCLTLLLFAAGVWASDEVNQRKGKADSSQIVIDEIVGMMITMIGIPITGEMLLFGFLAFRFFDISKLPPAGAIDSRLKNGWGVMLDDVVAGVYGNILLHLILVTKL